MRRGRVCKIECLKGVGQMLGERKQINILGAV